MKYAQDIRAGSVVIMKGAPTLVTKAEFNKSGRNSSVMKFKFRNLVTGGTSEGTYKIDERFEDVILDRADVTYSYKDGDNYVFVDEEFNQYEVSKEFLEDTLKYLEDQMPCQIVFYEGRALSIELPTKIVREIVYTEPAAKGDTSGKVMKLGRLSTGFEMLIPAFINIGEKIEIDTRTDEYVSRAKE
jgi:elongation factor P